MADDYREERLVYVFSCKDRTGDAVRVAIYADSIDEAKQAFKENDIDAVIKGYICMTESEYKERY